MSLLKIHGERNSGTNFIRNILEINGFNVYEQEIKENICYNWKHGIPKPKTNRINFNNKIVDIFIFRNLNDWLTSMYYNPYHLKKINDFSNFLTNKQESTEKHMIDGETEKFLNIDDNDKTIFEIRYYKFNKIIEYAKKNKDVIFINLSFLQNEQNLLLFFQKLNIKYMDNCLNNFKTNIPHTKNGLAIKNRNYDINLQNYQNVINKYKKNKIENFIDNIEFNYF